jgi:hypothetical protein
MAKGHVVHLPVNLDTRRLYFMNTARSTLTNFTGVQKRRISPRSVLVHVSFGRCIGHGNNCGVVLELGSLTNVPFGLLRTTVGYGTPIPATKPGQCPSYFSAKNPWRVRDSHQSGVCATTRRYFCRRGTNRCARQFFGTTKFDHGSMGSYF